MVREIQPGPTFTMPCGRTFSRHPKVEDRGGNADPGAGALTSSTTPPASLPGYSADCVPEPRRTVMPRHEAVAVGGPFDSDTATGIMPVAHRVAGALQSRRS